MPGRLTLNSAFLSQSCDPITVPRHWPGLPVDALPRYSIYCALNLNSAIYLNASQHGYILPTTRHTAGRRPFTKQSRRALTSMAPRTVDSTYPLRLSYWAKAVLRQRKLSICHFHQPSNPHSPQYAKTVLPAANHPPGIQPRFLSGLRYAGNRCCKV